MKSCKWTYQDIEDYYDTQCEEGYAFVEGNVKDNKFKYCPYCGKLIKEAKA